MVPFNLPLPCDPIGQTGEYPANLLITWKWQHFSMRRKRLARAGLASFSR